MFWHERNPFLRQKQRLEALTQFLSAIYILCSVQTPLYRAFYLAGQALKNPFYKKEVNTSSNFLYTGHSLTHALQCLSFCQPQDRLFLSNSLNNPSQARRLLNYCITQLNAQIQIRESLYRFVLNLIWATSILFLFISYIQIYILDHY